ncbi:STAS/SEC14 domain-containing protein [Bizionia arctica]|uniref:STAS/SEC14 domain-containing protein n=1 Tax=Bizionia arctica TaxID=1495645 RepID=A0A917GK85_9FLAO|nr:STAS/SEC14 domain-containing protein [Bizionia arctica]GGG49279.1 hypothetical protein GCM10010976_20690 [Bizionia arctica]
MIEQIKTFKTNALAIEVIDGFTETDEKLAQKFFKEKLDEGFETVNLLVSINEYKISNTNAKAFFEDIIFVLRNYKNLGHLAIVGHSKLIKALVPLDNFFFKRLGEGKEERYFDVSQLEEAFEFITE